MYTSVFIWRSAAAPPSNLTSASIVLIPGVGNASGLWGPPSSPATVASLEVAFSTLAAYPHLEQDAIKSSPASVRTMNSVDSLPPIAPELASTATNRRPHLVKMRQ